MKIFEIAAIITTILSALTARYNSKSTWIFGLISCVLYMKVFIDKQLYYQTTLQIVFFCQSFIGLLYWYSDTNKIKKTTPKILFLFIIFCFILLASLLILPIEIDKKMEFVATLGAFIATYLLSMKYTVNWLLWILVDILSAILFYNCDLVYTSILYIVLAIYAIYAYYQWETTNEV